MVVHCGLLGIVGDYDSTLVEEVPFLVMLTLWLHGWRYGSVTVCWCTTFVQTGISQTSWMYCHGINIPKEDFVHPISSAGQN